MSPFCPLVLLSCIGVGLASFNCLNPGYNCKQNGACDYFGRCKCPPGFQGYDCGLDSSTISSSADCRATCLNKGICYSNTLCYCTEDFVGSQCEIPVLSAECGMSSMTVRSFQPPAFQGEMYLKQSMFGCQLREMVTDVPGVRMFELAIPHRAISPCSLTKTKNNETGDTIFEVDVATAHHKGLFSMSDTVHQVKCVYEARRIGEKPVDVTKDKNPFKISLRNDNDQLFQQVPRGDIYFFTVEGSGKFPDSRGTRVSYLEAYGVDQQTGMVKSVKLIENECPVRSTINNFGISISNEERSQHGVFIGRAKVESFPVIDGEPLRLDYRAKICKNQCPQAHCNSPQPLQMPQNTPFKHVVNPIEIV
ncbi:EGF-like domain containing protein 2 [Ostrea edulis]|uniref:EGF-like domain containing protein 2 n=1 Tax=Ostrea edulis TaxID=37623 RepID=UPI0020948CE0|nr:EGF-like domain containing protein 2 [Ostrea edulis]XP_048779893.1 EGF-like domain containing protein 2 [Ostrea edulis]XP_048779895.1 EGF-like domain containing protein 2 [Ostrea edulis]XP_048779896.1 EGF-like domain containing protein 2 [Ostrea edulis]XP_048779897.1 EGF-like domain containing protein 2 [Ostrea edulis]XP_055996343.1 EGF-like domain containing protein 2 [Ostrea edulis]